MAEGFLNAALSADSRLRQRYSAASAGIAAQSGQPATLDAVNVMKDGWNIDIKGHRARRITPGDIRDAYLILAMEHCHKALVASMAPDCLDRLFTLKEFVYTDLMPNNVKDIQDPFGRPVSAYQDCAREIHKAVDALVKLL